MNGAYEAINDLFVHLFNNILKYEEQALVNETFNDITINDFHAIEAIGIEKPRNMTAIAKALDITVGTLTITMNNLVKKGYVKRSRSAKDRRVVLVSLTEKGRAAYNHHTEFHDAMINDIIKMLPEEQLGALTIALKALQGYFVKYKEEK